MFAAFLLIIFHIKSDQMLYLRMSLPDVEYRAKCMSNLYEFVK